MTIFNCLGVALVIICQIVFTEEALSWDNEITHRDISKIAAEGSALSKGTGDYLSKLGLDRALLEKFILNGTSKYATDWIQDGSFLEDAGNPLQGLVGQARYNNHFHNPLKGWDNAGLDEYMIVPVPNPVPPFIPVFAPKRITGESALKWAQDNVNQPFFIGGDWSWQTIRSYFYRALTVNKDIDRQAYFAQTFRGLGHQMHVLQDMSVPAHVRNDAHQEEGIQDLLMKNGLPTGDLYFEMWAKKYHTTINAYASKPQFPQVDTATQVGRYVPISQFYDTEQYNEGVAPSINPAWGLAEYTNSNFASADTIFTEGYNKSDNHYFPFPNYDPQCYTVVTQAKPGFFVMQRFLSKVCQGEPVVRFAAAGPLFPYLWPRYRGSLKLDEASHREYTSKLIPRAVGYSAGLLDYFFRGDIRLTFQSGTSPGYVITNNTREDMSGMFEIYYDNAQEERGRAWKDRLDIKASQKSVVINLPIVSDAKEPGKYILVFRGKLGNEEDAVAGYVTSRSIEITPPEQQVYAMVDASTGKGFDTILVRLRNRSTSEAMQNGTLKAIVKYKQNTQGSFQYTASDPVTVRSLDSAQATEYSFTFPNPLPIHATDVYLYVSFTGTIGTEANAVAVGERDISEPTPVDLFNNMDRTCIHAQWYTAGSPAVISLFDTNKDGRADTWDVYSHDVRDVYIRFSPYDEHLSASPTEYNYRVSKIVPGAHVRALYILADYRFSYGIYNKWLPHGVTGDPWTHIDESFVFDGYAVKEQTEMTSDPASCGSRSSCPKVHTPTYHTYRGTDLWGGAGLIYINAPYPETAICP